MTGDDEDHDSTADQGASDPAPQPGDRDANVIPRGDLRAGVVECPLCHRQLAAPLDHAIVQGPADAVTVATADAIECPVCDGVTFVVDE